MSGMIASYSSCVLLMILSSVALVLGIMIVGKNAYFSVQDAQGNTWKAASIPTASSTPSQVPIKLMTGTTLKMQMKTTAGGSTNVPTTGTVFETSSNDSISPNASSTMVVGYSASGAAGKSLVFEKQTTGDYLIRTDETPSLYIGYDSTNDVVGTYSYAVDPKVTKWTVNSGL